jgi:hypothetical protein
MISATAVNTGLVGPPLKSESTEREAITRLRLAAGVVLLAEIILPVVEESAFSRPDLLTIEIQAIWLVFTVCLLAATWHPRFGRVWKPAVVLFAASLIFGAGILSMKGPSVARFMFLLVLLPVGGICLPWETPWQIAMNSLCIVLGSFLSIQFDRQKRPGDFGDVGHDRFLPRNAHRERLVDTSADQYRCINTGAGRE